MKLLGFLIITTLFSLALNAEIVYESRSLDDSTNLLNFSVIIPHGDFIYKDYLDVSCDSPEVQLSNILYSQEPQPYYDQTFKETKKVFKSNFTLALKAIHTHPLSQQAYVHFTYYQHSKKRCVTELFPILIIRKTTETCIDASADIIQNQLSTQTVQKTQASENIQPFSLPTWLIEMLQTEWFMYAMLIILALYIFMRSKKLSLFIAVTGGLFYASFRLLPLHMFYWFIAFCALCIGLYLLLTSIKKESRRWYLSFLGVFLVAGSLIGFAKAYSTTYLYRLSLPTQIT